ncbi:MAG TPA: SDR family NAD(P)-dependent oxidoreductase, partial [Acidimicrobiales bacterium]|nr:SDR family NAD(P)-dependent oxidoreductase [Acidimicrobiales bacterium]
MLVNMSEDDFNAVMNVHLKGHFCPTRHAVGYWREKVKASGEPVKAALVFTSSAAGLYGNVGQFNYAAAKSGIATMARVAGAELKRYGVVANAIAPAARTRMTESLFADTMAPPDAGQFDAMDPANIAPLVVWLGSNENTDVTCETFEVSGGKVSVAENWRPGPEQDKGDRWDPAELGPVIRELVGKSERIGVIGAR